MALKYSTPVRNARLDVVESTIGSAPLLVLFTGAAPASPATANSGTKVAILTLPSDWMAAAGSGTKAKSGTWQDTSADNAGTIAHFRIFNAGDTTQCDVQGTCTNTGDGGDMTFDNVVVNAGQSITITTFTLTAGNA
jgi:hypothetical protein